ncbi:hypothetical protein QMK61_08870 [Fulvimonas sp. R45]|jgi:hypothetical protein|uniref:hypothetical protein n=1 Tax=Fulvimonas sp. R45 TaxID=3045937 RepID=UPI00265D871B|nr:hypothetical protein [Fulvimonas sp. R45]MDO1528936.1 hypothetical protein [Fulvimonas sp. R45]
MSSLWTDLLFLHGHIHDPALARRLARLDPTPKPGRKRPSAPAAPAPARWPARLAGALRLPTDPQACG